MKQDTRDFIVPIRMSYDEKQKITQRANKAGKNVSEFVRCSALGSKIKEKPDKEFYEVIKEISKFIRVLDELERIVYHKNFIDERVLKEELEKWREFRTMVKEKFL